MAPSVLGICLEHILIMAIFLTYGPSLGGKTFFFFVIVCQPTKNVNPCLKSRAGAIGQSGWGVGVRVEVEGGWAVGK